MTAAEISRTPAEELGKRIVESDTPLIGPDPDIQKAMIALEQALQSE